MMSCAYCNNEVEIECVEDSSFLILKPNVDIVNGTTHGLTILRYEPTFSEDFEISSYTACFCPCCGEDYGDTND